MRALWSGLAAALAAGALSGCGAATAGTPIGPAAGARGAAAQPSARAIVQFRTGVSAAQQRSIVQRAGGVVIRDLHVIRALGVRVPRDAFGRLRSTAGVRAVTADAPIRPQTAGGTPASAWRPTSLATAFVQSTRTDKAWTDQRTPATGRGVTVAIIDTGVAGDLPDFKDPATSTSRVVASVVTNPAATTATDTYGHGTHIAGLIAGDGRDLAPSDPLYGRYVGTAPDARLVSIKVSDDHGNATVMDVIDGLQFVVDHGAEYGIRVVNLSLGSTVASSYRQDPLDAAVEAAWSHGVVVVAAAGNRGTAGDAVSYAPANDPYAIVVGAVDDQGTKDLTDDTLAKWSSRGVTQDGFTKPDLVAPGAHIAAPLAPGSDFGGLCTGCVVNGRYFRMSGTSVAAPIVAGIAADVLSVHPQWRPDQVKGALTYNSGTLDANGDPVANMRLTGDGSWEVAADLAVKASSRELAANTALSPSPLLDPATGWIATGSSWQRASWKDAAGGLRASWGAASWACDCAGSGDPAAATRASWGRASWKSFFGDSPSD